MTNRIILLHGFNVRDGGEHTVGRLRPYLAKAGFANVNLVSYGWTDMLMVKRHNDRFARLLASMSEPGDVVIAHSNGCAMAYRALRDYPVWAEFRDVVFINPALKPKLPIPPALRSLHVFHSKGDNVVGWARLLSPFSLWGNMGAVGYRGPFDARVRNHDLAEYIDDPAPGHSGVFSDDLAPTILPAIVATLKSTLILSQ